MIDKQLINKRDIVIFIIYIQLITLPVHSNVSVQLGRRLGLPPFELALATDKLPSYSVVGGADANLLSFLWQGAKNNFYLFK